MVKRPVNPVWVECFLVTSLLGISIWNNLAPWIPFAVGGTWWLYINTMTRWSFRSPSSRKEPITEHWVSVRVQTDIGPLQLYHSSINRNAPLVLACHGWSSGSIRMTDRVQPFLDRGFNAVLIDLPSHGSSSSLSFWSAEQSVSVIMQAVNVLIEEFGFSTTVPVMYYGHSMGGFVGFRISKRRDELHHRLELSGWVMESPMTGYSEIFGETCRMLKLPKIFKPSLQHRVMNRFKRLNPAATDINTLSDADIPAWGILHEPCLLVQADPDERLGATHYERLIHQMELQNKGLLTTRMLPSLHHTGSHNHPLRNKIVGEWLDDIQHNER